MLAVTNHIVSGYDSDLNDLSRRLAELGSVAESMLTDAITALKTQDMTLAQSVKRRDQTANRIQARIDDDAVRILALRSPMATDLRRTIGAIRVATDLERIGDLAEGVAKRTLDLDPDTDTELSQSIVMMGRQVKAHLSTALDGLMRDDLDIAVQTWLADNDIDEMYNAILRQLIDRMSGSPRQVDGCTSLIFAAKNLERVGDHTSNICEVMYYTRTGRQLVNDDAVRSRIQKAG